MVQLRTHYVYQRYKEKRRQRQFHETRVYVRMTRKLRNDVYHMKMLLSGVILVNSKNNVALVWMNSRESNTKPTEKDTRLTAKSINSLLLITPKKTISKLYYGSI